MVIVRNYLKPNVIYLWFWTPKIWNLYEGQKGRKITAWGEAPRKKAQSIKA